jgi:pyruvate dehydrogenase E1 component alpha subunit
MFEAWAAQDPIERYRTWLRDHAEMSDDEEDEITAGVKRLLNEALDRAEQSPLPSPATLETSVFASPEDLDTPHHR